MTQNPLPEAQQRTLNALRPDTPAGYLVVYLDGTIGLVSEPGRARTLSDRTRGVIVALLPDPQDLPGS